jgi:hypothetical protein
MKHLHFLIHLDELTQESLGAGLAKVQTDLCTIPKDRTEAARHPPVQHFLHLDPVIDGEDFLATIAGVTDHLVFLGPNQFGLAGHGVLSGVVQMDKSLTGLVKWTFP